MKQTIAIPSLPSTNRLTLTWPNKKHPSPITFESHQRLTQFPASPYFSKLIWGDNQKALASILPQYTAKIALVYLDPPFDSNANYSRIIRLRNKKDGKQFRQTQYTDHWKQEEYLQFIYERLLIIKELLAQNGSLYLHADWHRIHHLRLLCDEVFGEENLLNEIIWHHDFGGRSPYFLARKHDNILLYKKGSEWKFHLDSLPDLPYQGKLHQYQNNKLKKGKKPTAVWHDIPTDFVWDIAYENKMSSQNTGYPTQKPIALLERLILLSSDAGDIILDPFLGSGTSALVAQKHHRNFIGIDSNWGAIHTTTIRLCQQSLQNNLSIVQTNSQPTNEYFVLNHRIENEKLVLLLTESPHRQTSLCSQLGYSPSDWKKIDWRHWVQSIAIDWNYNDKYMKPDIFDAPLSTKILVQGQYTLPNIHQQIYISITDICFCTQTFLLIL